MQDQDHRPLLLAGPSLGLRLSILAVAAVLLMVADRQQRFLPVVRSWLSAAAYPVHRAVDAPFSAWRYLGGALETRDALRADNARLATENRDLKLRMLRFEALEQENARLRAARAGSARVAEKSLVAEILRVDLDPFRQRVLVDKGSRDGVFVGQAVLDADGVFGQVTRVGPLSAEVIMISDPDHAIPVQINRTGVRTIAVGMGQTGKLVLPYLPRNADVVTGDLVVSSGLGGIFPPGYPVARIGAIHRDPAEPLLTVDAMPLAHLDRDPEVMLVWFPRPPADLDATPADSPAVPAATGQAPAAAPAPAAPQAPAPAPAPAATRGAPAAVPATAPAAGHEGGH